MNLNSMLFWILFNGSDLYLNSRPSQNILKGFDFWDNKQTVRPVPITYKLLFTSSVWKPDPHLSGLRILFIKQNTE